MIIQEGQTPLHCLVTADGPLNKAVLQYLIETFPSTVLMRDLMGRTILHWICESHDLDLNMLHVLLASVADAASLRDVVRICSAFSPATVT
ncbi:Ankyrin repeat-containing domain [Phytophthora cactorum]|nr:Ankyrin repeat-containing domain [Phytophthora cactorum]